MRYYSQNGQDKFLNEIIFKNKQNGFYIDIGAYDGISLSNTYFFEEHLNWDGICVEANPIVFQLLKKNRRSKNLNCCVYEKKSEVNFMVVTGPGEVLSGIYDAYDERHINRIDECIKSKGGKKSLIMIPAMPFNDILESSQVIDYCNIDVEGSELAILKSIDFEKSDIRIFTIENNYGTAEVRKFLKNKGYSMIAVVGDDEIFEKYSTRYYYIFRMHAALVKQHIRRFFSRLLKSFATA